MIRVLQGFVANKYGGVSIYIYNNYKNINKEKIQYDFLYINDVPDFADDCIKEGAQFYKIHKMRNLFMYTVDLYKVIMQNNYSVVHFNLPFADIIPVVVAKAAGVRKIILHAHSTSIDSNSFIKRKVLNIYHMLSLFFLRFVKIDVFFACSNAAGRFVFGDRIVKKKNYFILNNAIDSSNYIYSKQSASIVRKNLNVAEEEFLVGHVGRFSYPKNHEFLINVFYFIQKIKKNSKLVLVGHGETEIEIRELVKRLNIEEKLIFLGFRNDVPKLMQAMDCFVLPSRFEGLPLVGIEAQAAGLPCFFADTITDELRITNLAHYLSLNDSPKKWAEIILEKSGGKRKDMSKEIRDAGYDIKEEIKKVEEFYMRGLNDE